MQGHVPFSTELFVWGAQGSSDETNILCRSFVDGAGKPLYARQFQYDESGNVVEDRLFGNISGHSVALTLGGNQQPIGNGVECAIRRMKYSSDGRNLLKESIELNGLKNIYGYVEGTDLMACKFIEYKGAIKQRTFYEYDSNNILIREISDDGNSHDKMNLAGVAERHIRVITPRTQAPYFGLPDAIEDRYLDVNSGREILLQKTEFVYTTGAKIAEKRIYDSTGAYRYTLHYKYDEKGNLKEETNELGQVAFSRYDENGNKVEHTGFDGRLTKKNHYDCANRLIQEEEYADNECRTTVHRYNVKNYKEATIDSFGNTTQYELDSFGNITKVYSPSTLTGRGSTAKPQLIYTYDCLGRRTSEINGEGTTKGTSYNLLGKPIEVLYSNGSRETFCYHLDGTLKSHTDQEGLITLYEYDYLSRVIKKTITSASGEIFSEETSVYSPFHLLSTTDIEGNTTRYQYDGAGRLIAEEMVGSNDLCKRIEYIYDALGRQERVIIKGEELDLITHTEKDIAGRVLLEWQEDSRGQILSKVAYEYDSAGHVAVKTTFHGDNENRERFFYDGFGRMIRQVDGLGHDVWIEYEENYYNPLGQRVLRKITIHPSGFRTIEIHDALGRVVSVEQKSPLGECLGIEEKFYDLAGHRAAQISHVYYHGKEEKNIATSWEYDSHGYLTQMIEADGTDPARITYYEYTVKGLLASIAKADGVCISYSYDPMGRVTSIYSSDGSCSYEYVYNLMHQMTQLIDRRSGKAIIRDYNAFGQMTKEVLPNGFNLENAYDSMGRRRSLSLPDGSAIRYAYDALYLRSVERRSSSGDPLYIHTYDEFDLSGSVLAETAIAETGRMIRSVDSLGRVQSINSSSFSQDQFRYDEDGRLVSYLSQNGKEEFSYDDKGQIISEEGSFSHRYQFDSLYNRKEKDSSSYEVNELNQLLSDGYSEYSYDTCGNLRCKRNAEEEILYDYDALDRLVSITKHGEYRLVFEYDGLHRRISTHSYSWSEDAFVLKDIKNYIYDGQNDIGAFDAQGQITELRILGSTSSAEIGSAVAIELQGQVYASVHDFRGNIVSLIDTSTNQVEEQYTYSAFGEERIMDSDGVQIERSKIANPWRLSSKRTDENSGLIYFGRRFYDSKAGRWITCDPKGFTDSMNLYAFVLNNPLTKLDLYGLEATNPDLAVSPSLWSRTFDMGRSALQFASSFVGNVLYNFFHHAFPAPGFLRDSGRNFSAWLSGKKAPKEDHSASYTIEGNRSFNNSIIAYSSGQNCTAAESIEQARTISLAADGEQVEGFHNSTRGLFLDTLESIIALVGFQTPTIEKTTKWIRECISKVGGIEGDGIVNWITWSQGSIMAKRVVENLTPEERKHLAIKGIGSGVLFDDNDAEVSHFVAPGDIVPQLSNFPKYVYSLFSGDSNVNFLPSSTRSWLLGDHSFTNPVYQDVIDIFCRKFIQGGRI